MSTLTKVFVILIFLISIGTVAIVATLYAQRTDWHDKFLKEVNQHYYSIQVLKAETEAREVQIRNLEKVRDAQKAKIEALQTEQNSKQEIITVLNRQITDLSGRYTALLEHAEALNRNLAVLIAKQEELQNLNVELRKQKDQAVAERQQAQAELFQLRGDLEKVMRDLETSEKAFIDASRQLEQLKAIVDRIREQGIPIEVLPAKRLDAKVRGVAAELDLVVISVGKNDGVTGGSQFTVYRGPQFVCKVVIEKVESNWSSGRILVKQMDPRVGDDATNDVNRAGATGTGQ